MKIRVLALALMLSSCLNNEDQSNDSASNENTETALATPSETTAVSFKALDGKMTDLASLTGKVVFLNFWATWCGPCIKEMPSLQAFYNKYQGNPNVEFLVVEIDNRPDLAQKFIGENKFTFPVYSPGSAVPETLLGQAVPTTVILDKNGNIAYRHEGMSDFVSQDFVNLFEGILAK